MGYENAAQLDRAMKRAIREAGVDPGDGYRQMLRDRFLCRVFSGDSGRFILKGGSGMLARIPDARATRDIDFATAGRESADGALSELVALASRDLGDFCSFRLTKSEESLDENGYSRLLKLRFASYVGQQEKDPVLIDLSLDCDPTYPPERIDPANRVRVEGLATSDYLVYSLPDQMADKLCAIMELQPGGWRSSRMKDLVDVISYATHYDFLLAQLRRAVACECARREMEVPRHFAAPEEWRGRFAAFARKGGVPEELAGLDEVSAFASTFFDPVLGDGSKDAIWDHASRTWRAG